MIKDLFLKKYSYMLLDIKVNKNLFTKELLGVPRCGHKKRTRQGKAEIRRIPYFTCSDALARAWLPKFHIPTLLYALLISIQRLHIA